MQIRLRNCVPDPLKDRDQDSDIWGKDVVLAPGSFIRLLAPSARGKTTLISCLYGTRSDYSGEILFDGEDRRKMKPGRLSQCRRESLAIVFQDLRLFDGLSGVENVLIKARLAGGAGKAEIAAFASELGMEKAMEKKVGIMSWGEKQRVALIRALVQPFEWILLDEPFSHLDSANRERACAAIKRETAKRKAGLIITCLDENRYFEYTASVRV
jgi:ABC-type lipoprotein export system ATPase subunit